MMISMTVDYEEDVDDVETEAADNDAAIDEEEDEDYINKDEAKRDLKERGLAILIIYVH